MVLAEDQNITLTRGPGVSVHYVIDMDGTIYQLVPDNKKPWATGVGNLKSESKLNHNIEAIKNIDIRSRVRSFLEKSFIDEVLKERINENIP